MGLRDLFKSRTGGAAEEPAAAVDDAVPTFGGGDDSPDAFTPRQNGIYQGGPPDHRFLRFHVTGKVYLAGGDDLAAARPLLGPGNSDPTVGQYTPAGRFVVVRRFERPVVFTVLAADDTGFTVRLTATDAAQTGEYRYDFVPDEAG